MAGLRADTATGTNLALHSTQPQIIFKPWRWASCPHSAAIGISFLPSAGTATVNGSIDYSVITTITLGFVPMALSAARRSTCRSPTARSPTTSTGGVAATNTRVAIPDLQPRAKAIAYGSGPPRQASDSRRRTRPRSLRGPDRLAMSPCLAGCDAYRSHLREERRSREDRAFP